MISVNKKSPARVPRIEWVANKVLVRLLTGKLYYGGNAGRRRTIQCNLARRKTNIQDFHCRTHKPSSQLVAQTWAHLKITARIHNHIDICCTVYGLNHCYSCILWPFITASYVPVLDLQLCDFSSRNRHDPMSGHASWGGGTRIQIASVVPVEVRRGLGQTDHKVDDLFRCHADVIRGNHPNRVVAISNQTAEGESALQRNRDPLPGKGVNDVLPGNIEWDEKTYAPVQRDIDTENRFGASLADNRSGGDIATRHDGPAADLNIEICSSPSEGLTLDWSFDVEDRSHRRDKHSLENIDRQKSSVQKL